MLKLLVDSIEKVQAARIGLPTAERASGEFVHNHECGVCGDRATLINQRLRHPCFIVRESAIDALDELLLGASHACLDNVGAQPRPPTRLARVHRGGGASAAAPG